MSITTARRVNRATFHLDFACYHYKIARFLF